MADDTEAKSSSQQVFDFSSTDFTIEELISTLHDMVNEYQKLALSFDKARAKQNDPKDDKTKTDESVDMLSLKREIAKLNNERSRDQLMIQKLLLENSKHNELIQAWNKSSDALTYIHNSQKSVNDKTGLGFCSKDDSSSKDTQPKLNIDKGKYIHFVKSVMVQEQIEPSKPIELLTERKNKANKYGIGYRPKISTD